jgi:methylmalonyl-CoA decarboxylase
MSGSIETEIEDGICTLTLKNEGKRNALTYGMMKSITEAVNDLEARADDYVLVITGAGEKAFSAGFDLDQDRDPDKESWWKEVNATIEAYEYPTVAMINGDTYGGAMEIVCDCDIRVGVSDARFGITPAKIGIVYSPQAITRVVRTVGTAKAKEFLFTGNAVDGEHAFEIGLLNHVVDDAEELESKAYGLAETMAGNAPMSLKSMKKIIAAIDAKDELSEAEIEWGYDMRMDAFDSRDHEEGVEAFSEGREPEFEGR